MRSRVWGCICILMNFPIPFLQYTICNSNSVTGMQAQVLLLNGEVEILPVTQRLTAPRNSSNQLVYIQNQKDHVPQNNGSQEAILRSKYFKLFQTTIYFLYSLLFIL